MTPEQEIIALDRFIDGLPDVDGERSDLDELFSVVRDIRRLDEPEWPDDDYPALAANHIADVLRSRATTQTTASEPESWTSYSNGHTLHAPQAREPRVRLLRHRHFREVAQTAAAILAVVLLAGMLAVVFQNQSGSHEGRLGGAATPPSASVTDPSLSALQVEAGFQIYAPTWLPPTWSLEPPTKPSRFSGYSTVQLTYLDVSQSIGIDIFEASPYQLTASMFPANVYDNSTEVYLGGGKTGRIHQEAGLIRLWWQQGDVAIQLQTGYAKLGGSDRFPISNADIVRIASSMQPVAQAPAQGTPTASGFPMTVTANGIPVTLESVEVETNTVFDFSVKLPPELAAQSELSVQSQRPVQLLTVSGLPAGTKDPTFEIASHSPGNSVASFAAVYNAVAPPDATLTITLLTLPYVTAPSSTDTFDGPWTFVVTPQMRSIPSATPNSSGYYDRITIAQAQQLVDFPIIQPGSLPDGLTHIDSDAMAGKILPTSVTKADIVTLEYPASDGTNAVSASETRLSTAMPFVRQNTLHLTSIDGTSAQVQLSQWTQTALTISGVSVTKLDTVQLESHAIYYTWQQNGVYISVSAQIKGQVTEAIMEQLIASMVGQESTPQPTPATPAGSTTFPMTVTANGVPVTLESVMVGNSRLRFLFSVKLPPEIAAASDILVEASSTKPIVQAEGVTAAANDPVWQFGRHLPGEQTAMFSLEYSSDPLPAATVMLTLQRLPFTATPSNPNTTEGPWTFTISHDDLMAESLALTNANNANALLTLPEAQQMVEFPIIQPQPVPNFLTQQDPQVSAVSILPHADTSADFVWTSYWEGDAGSRGVHIGETQLSITMPYILQDTLYFMGTDGTPTTTPVQNWSQDSLTIDGVTIERLDTTEANTYIIYYTWERNGVFSVLYAPLDQQLTDSVLQQMVTSMIDLPSSITLTPPPPSATTVQPLLTPSAKHADQESASQWAIDYTAPPNGPAPKVDQVRLMTFADATNQTDVDKSWTGASANPAEPGTPVWVVEVEGANPIWVCPFAYMQCDASHIEVVVNAQTGEFVGMYLPSSSLGPPTS